MRRPQHSQALLAKFYIQIDLLCLSLIFTFFSDCSVSHWSLSYMLDDEEELFKDWDILNRSVVMFLFRQYPTHHLWFSVKVNEQQFRIKFRIPLLLCKPTVEFDIIKIAFLYIS